MTRYETKGPRIPTATGHPPQILMAEHEVILQALDALQQRLDAMQDPTAADRAYVDGGRVPAGICRHVPPWQGRDSPLHTDGRAGLPPQGGPIAVMLAEHQTGRAFIRGLAEAAAKIGSDPKAGDEIRSNGYGYITLLRNHIAKENQVLFSMADRTLSAADQHDLQRAFERFEVEEMGAGVHERMLGLLAELQAGATDLRWGRGERFTRGARGPIGPPRRIPREGRLMQTSLIREFRADHQRIMRQRLLILSPAKPRNMWRADADPPGLVILTSESPIQTLPIGS